MNPFEKFKASQAKRGPANTETIGKDGRHTFDLAKGAATARRLKSGEPLQGVDNDSPVVVPSEFSVFNPGVSPNRRRNDMAKAKPKQSVVEAHAPEADLKPGETVTHEDGSTETLNPVPEREPTRQELAEAKTKAKIAAKAEKKAAAEKAKAEREAKAAEKAAEREAKKGETEAAKAERKAKLAELAEGRNYQGSMLALTERVKSGSYVKSATGQLRSTDALAEALDGVQPLGVIQLGKDLLKLEENPYAKLNVGQQSMNLRNRLRGAITKGVIKIEDVVAYVAEHGLDVSEQLAKEKAERAEKAAAAKAEREAKAAEKAAAKSAVEKTEAELETTE